jgi:hypothetical protein
MESFLWGRPPSAVQQAKPASSPRRPWQAAEKLNQAVDFWVAAALQRCDKRFV